ncbi:hypothetical protein K2Z84_19510 [Candidatus Binatia bacterium]|nr:hypothetical protein [Candidatus Binatia bacterium]
MHTLSPTSTPTPTVPSDPTCSSGLEDDAVREPLSAEFDVARLQLVSRQRVSSSACRFVYAIDLANLSQRTWERVLVDAVPKEGHGLADVMGAFGPTRLGPNETAHAGQHLEFTLPDATPPIALNAFTWSFRAAGPVSTVPGAHLVTGDPLLVLSWTDDGLSLALLPGAPGIAEGDVLAGVLPDGSPFVRQVQDLRETDAGVDLVTHDLPLGQGFAELSWLVDATLVPEAEGTLLARRSALGPSLVFDRDFGSGGRASIAVKAKFEPPRLFALLDIGARFFSARLQPASVGASLEWSAEFPAFDHSREATFAPFTILRLPPIVVPTGPIPIVLTPRVEGQVALRASTGFGATLSGQAVGAAVLGGGVLCTRDLGGCAADVHAFAGDLGSFGLVEPDIVAEARASVSMTMRTALVLPIVGLAGPRFVALPTVEGSLVGTVSPEAEVCVAGTVGFELGATVGVDLSGVFGREFVIDLVQPEALRARWTIASGTTCPECGDGVVNSSEEECDELEDEACNGSLCIAPGMERQCTCTELCDATGVWRGSYSGSDGEGGVASGTFLATIVQHAGSLSGNIQIFDSGAGLLAGPVFGTVNCDSITFGTAEGISFTATRGGECASGTWRASSFGTSGSWGGCKD